jgi:hypothetical protein
MSLEYVKSLTGDNPQVEVIYSKIAERLLHRIKETEIPLGLEYIVEEATIRRFNRIGSEGMKSESVEGHSVTYIDEDELAPYESAIVAYLEAQEPDDKRKPGVVYFL